MVPVTGHKVFQLAKGRMTDFAPIKGCTDRFGLLRLADFAGPECSLPAWTGASQAGPPSSPLLPGTFGVMSEQDFGVMSHSVRLHCVAWVLPFAFEFARTFTLLRCVVVRKKWMLEGSVTAIATAQGSCTSSQCTEPSVGTSWAMSLDPTPCPVPLQGIACQPCFPFSFMPCP